MMQRWGVDAIRFMEDASEFGTYYQELSQALLPYLPKDGHICDAGCGLGYLAQELSKYCKAVTALDTSNAAIAALKKRDIPKNMYPRCDDIFKISAQFDAMIFCYFGRTHEIFDIAKKLCRGNVLIVKRECSDHTFSVGKVEHREHTVENIALALERLGVPHHKQSICLELGQPFCSLDDALVFFELYNKSAVPVTEETVKNRLVLTADEDFPLYLPSLRKMELIVFSANDLPRGDSV